MRQKELNKKSDNDLLKIKKKLEIDLVRARSIFGSELIKNKETRIISKRGFTKTGTRTSLRKQLRRTIAQINNTLNQRGLSEEVNKGKPESKRRRRRLGGRMKNEI